MASSPSHLTQTATASAAANGGGSVAAPDAPGASKGLLFDISGIDLSKRLLSRKDLEALNPHRGDMALLDAIVWHSQDYALGIGLKHTRDDEFWVKGHFPGKPMFPGVLMIEAGAQVAVYLYNARLANPLVAAFTRIDNAVFRAAVVPGDDLYFLCKEIKWSRRGFTCDVQGIINAQKIAFEARVSGIAL